MTPGTRMNSALHGAGGASGGHVHDGGALVRHGFTLLEILIALVLFTVITAIVYATFSTVVNSAEEVRVDVERVRLEQYLIRSLTTNLSTVFTDAMYEDPNFYFQGIDFENEDGPADSLTFCSTAPLIGGFSLPGDVKLVTYEVPGLRDEDMFLSDDYAREEAAAAYEEMQESEVLVNPYSLGRKLTISETPMMTGNTQSMHGTLEEDEDIFEMNEQLRTQSRGREGFSGAFGETQRNDPEEERRREEAERRREERSRPRPSDFMDQDEDEYDEPMTNEAMFQTPYMEMPIRTLDIEYFDGEDWVTEWNSSAYENQTDDQVASASLGETVVGEPRGRLPWAVRFRINFEKSEDELAEDRQAGYDEEEDVDFEMVVPVRQGQGITQHVYDVPELQDLVPGYSGAGLAAGQNGTGDDEEEDNGGAGGGGGKPPRNNGNSDTQYGSRN